MPDYTGLKRISDAKVRKRCIAGLKGLREALALKIPAKSGSHRLLLASWNIREFDSGKYGPRSDEAYFYITEIISRFDIVAIQEVRQNLYALQRLRRLLGSWWDFIVTDVTLGRSGNSERMAFLFDRRKVDFAGLAAELVLPPGKQPDPAILQFARSPYVAGFKSGWANFTLATVHIYYGKGVPDDPRRVQEIADFGKVLAKNAAAYSAAPVYSPDASPARDNLIALGDFNIFNRADKTMEGLTKAGFIVPDELQKIPGSNVAKNKHYDQIAYHKRLESMTPTGQAGVFDFFEQVYRLDQESEYASEFGNTNASGFKDWRTYRMSDHLPMWIEFDTDWTQKYLDSIPVA